jgi:signal peptidase II
MRRSSADGASSAVSTTVSNAMIFWVLIVAVVTTDVITKAIASTALLPRGLPHSVLGDVVRLTLVYNPGAAFGLHLGPYSRWIFMVLTIGALIILWRLYRATRPGDVPRAIALGLVCAGAIGNLIDRVQSPMGVIDFIDVGWGDMRWPTFNVADMAVSTGAFLLAWVLWGEDRVAAAAPASTDAPAPAAPLPTESADRP